MLQGAKAGPVWLTLPSSGAAATHTQLLGALPVFPCGINAEARENIPACVRQNALSRTLYPLSAIPRPVCHFDHRVDDRVATTGGHTVSCDHTLFLTDVQFSFSDGASARLRARRSCSSTIRSQASSLCSMPQARSASFSSSGRATCISCNAEVWRQPASASLAPASGRANLSLVCAIARSTAATATSSPQALRWERTVA